MVCSSDDLLDKRINEYAVYLFLSGYSYLKVKSQLKEATIHDREGLFKSVRFNKKKTL